MSMVRVYLADDNDLFRESLMQTYPWQEMGCTIVGNARDGGTALREILELCPDIVLLDIRMPGMSGLEIASKLKNREYAGRVIIITGYSEFGYAQKCIRIGVFDYLLKPIEERELRDVIDRAVRDMAEHKKGVSPESDSDRAETAGTDLSPLENHSEDHSAADGCRVSESLLDACEGLQEAASALNHFFTDSLGYVLYEVMKVCPDLQAVGEQPMDEWKSWIQDDLRRMVRNNSRVGVWPVTWHNVFYVFLLFKTFDESREYDIAAVRLANDLYQDSVREHRDACISISGCHPDFGEIADAVHEADFAYDSRFFVENRHVIHYHSLKSRSMAGLYPIMERVENYYGVLRQNPAGAEEALDAVEELCRKGNFLDLPLMKSILTNMAIMTLMVLHGIPAEVLRRGNNPDESAENSQEAGRNPVEEVRTAATLEDAFRILHRQTVRLQMLSQNPAGGTMSAVTRKILDYLGQHYPEKIDLQEVCDYVGLSQGYVSRILKSDTGETFVNLLNRIRIDRAREMLKTHQYKVYEVAEATGFSNYAYFYQTYRKLTGESPTKA